MIHIQVPSDKRLVWYLAMEEYIGHTIRHYPEGVFFTWVVDPTVVFGRHQVMEQEVNMAFCHANNIQAYRRKSGGGCVYADRGNLMLSQIVPNTHAEQVFQQYLDKVAALLRELGLPAVKSEHNDILVDGHKVSGNACYTLRECTIVHGTMLYDVDFDMLQAAISPTRQKLEKHGVQSVRQRVCNLRPMLAQTHDIGELADHLINRLCTKSICLTKADSEAIDTIEQTYLNPEFIHSK